MNNGGRCDPRLCAAIVTRVRWVTTRRYGLQKAGGAGVDVTLTLQDLKCCRMYEYSMFFWCYRMQDVVGGRLIICSVTY